MEQLAPQLVTKWNYTSVTVSANFHRDSNEGNELTKQRTTASIRNELERASTRAVTLVNQMCGSHGPADILNKLLSRLTARSKTWRLVKRVSLSTTLPRYSELLFK